MMDGLPAGSDPSAFGARRDGVGAELVQVAGLGAFQQPMAEIVERAERVDIRHFETLPVAQAQKDLHPAASLLVQQARTVVGAILHACESFSAAAEDGSGGLHDSFLPFERAMDAAVQAGGASVRAVEDVAFLVQLELRQREERLRRVNDASGGLAVIGECDSALRRIRKGFGAIDVAIARAASVAPRLDFSSELEESLLVREAYAKFRTRLAAEGTPAPGELYAKMRVAGTHIAVLVGWKAYPLLRVRDRLQLRDLQQRILAWLRPENRVDEIAGMRLWQDVVAFVEMLAQVNRRQELLKHDAKLVGELLATFGHDAGVLDEASLAALAPLKGLDDELDALVASRGTRSALSALLERIASRLGAATGGTTA